MGAHPHDTWCKRVQAQKPAQAGQSEEHPDWNKVHFVNWLEDEHMLPAVLPSARVMRYGYESQGWGPDGLITKPEDISQRLLRALADERKVL